MKKIIHVISAVSEEASGPSYSVVRLCEELIGLGCPVTLATLDWSPMQVVPPFLKSFPLGLGPRKFGRCPEMKKWLMEQAQCKNVDIIHSHGIWMMPNIYTGWAAKKGLVPLVVSPRGTFSEWAMAHGTKLKPILWRIIQGPALKTTSCFQATSEEEYFDIRRLGFKQPVAIVPIGIDIPDLSPKPSKRGKKTLLFLGRIHKKKGLDILLYAWAKVQKNFPDWNLRVVGPDQNGYLREMQELASRLNLVRCDFTGPLYGRDKWQAYRDADIFVLPTYSENFGIAVAEALASGNPAIVSKGAPWSGLQSHEAGWWIDIGVAPLVNCLNEALSLSSERLNEMGRKGQRWMANDYGWGNIAKKMFKVYEWILSGGPSPEFIRTN